MNGSYFVIKLYSNWEGWGFNIMHTIILHDCDWVGELGLCKSQHSTQGFMEHSVA